MNDDLKVYPRILIRDKSSGKIREFGKSRNDVLVVSEDGRCLYYEDLCEGGSHFGDFEFVKYNDCEGDIKTVWSSWLDNIAFFMPTEFPEGLKDFMEIKGYAQKLGKKNLKIVIDAINEYIDARAKDKLPAFIDFGADEKFLEMCRKLKERCDELRRKDNNGRRRNPKRN